jgi:hypothetical protein
MAYRYDLSVPDEGGREPYLLPCGHCGYPEPRDAGPILVLQGIPESGGDPAWHGGYRLLSCPHCELTSYARVPS